MSKYDWETIELDFCAGQLSIRHLAARHEVSTKLGAIQVSMRQSVTIAGWLVYWKGKVVT